MSTQLHDQSGAALARRLFASTAPRAVVLIRLAVGIVFTSEGIQKFLFPQALGAGRFAKIGIPAPEVMGPFVGSVELVCGVLILLGLATRLAALPLVGVMTVALLSTKIPILLGHGFWIFANPSTSKHGLWSMLHEARTDMSMLLGALFLFIAGAGAWSLDAGIMRRLARSQDPAGRAPRAE
ncbi:DoxX family protein [Polyangium spumosum]|uniref:DoxX family membrane protein n=1 Tax=Polyangium spumosum TaxID=889282 RepID=A0A6N7PXI8_9BACT|nr:DoxX family protein [Polyangium spumosum]MRG96599.1 DoxX family membrane protein [Polyangium spumosum]